MTIDEIITRLNGHNLSRDDLHRLIATATARTRPADGADLIAEAVRATFDSMSTTDKNAIHTAILRAQRKALKDQMKALKEPRSCCSGDNRA